MWDVIEFIVIIFFFFCVRFWNISALFQRLIWHSFREKIQKTFMPTADWWNLFFPLEWTLSVLSMDSFWRSNSWWLYPYIYLHINYILCVYTRGRKKCAMWMNVRVHYIKWHNEYWKYEMFAVGLAVLRRLDGKK